MPTTVWSPPRSALGVVYAFLGALSLGACGPQSAAERGQALFSDPAFSPSPSNLFSCATCHGARPVAPGRHASTQRDIAPLAPAAHAARFTDTAKTEKWFRRNCNDVLGRECTPGEKADVLAWLMTLKWGAAP